MISGLSLALRRAFPLFRELTVAMSTNSEPNPFFKDSITSQGIFKYYVNGEWRESSSGKTVGINNPTTQAVEYQVQGNLFNQS